MECPQLSHTVHRINPLLRQSRRDDGHVEHVHCAGLRIDWSWLEQQTDQCVGTRRSKTPVLILNVETITGRLGDGRTILDVVGGLLEVELETLLIAESGGRFPQLDVLANFIVSVCKAGSNSTLVTYRRRMVSQD